MITIHSATMSSSDFIHTFPCTVLNINTGNACIHTHTHSQPHLHECTYINTYIHTCTDHKAAVIKQTVWAQSYNCYCLCTRFSMTSVQVVLTTVLEWNRISAEDPEIHVQLMKSAAGCWWSLHLDMFIHNSRDSYFFDCCQCIYIIFTWLNSGREIVCKPNILYPNFIQTYHDSLPNCGIPVVSCIQ